MQRDGGDGMTICFMCGKPVAQLGKRPAKFCSQICRNRAWRDPLRSPASQRFERSSLNEAVDAAYAACGGQHVASGIYVVRDFYSVTRAVQLCAGCGVPIVGKVDKFTSTMSFEKGAA